METERIRNYIDNGNTLLGIGPMSINCVNAAIDIANENSDIPVMLIASRRQIDHRNIKRGYVNNWSTDEFTKYVREKQNNDNLILARDHGGPWQNNIEIDRKYSINDAMKSAKESYLRDIEAGLDILHIDPSIDIFEQLSFEKIFDRLTDLYEFCDSKAKELNRNIEFEIGTEEQMEHVNSIFEFTSMLDLVKRFCENQNLKKPLFVVTQIGTKVMETKNIGILNQQQNKRIISEIEALCRASLDKGYYVKVHNTDYLDRQVLSIFPNLKISAANVAPEFGVCETKSFINLLEKYYLIDLENEFLEYSYNSHKWDKWITLGSNLSNRDKAIISGHYIFSDDKFKLIKEQAQKQIKNLNIDEYLKNEIKKNIMQYISCFNVKKGAETLCQQ